MITLGIDARPVTAESRGLRTYSRGLVKALATKERGITIMLYTHDLSLHQVIEESSSCQIAILPSWTSLKTHLGLPFRIRRDRIQVMAFLANFAWLMPVCPTIVTIHDMTTEHFPAIFYPTRRQKVLRMLRKHLAARADLIMTDSVASQHDIVRYLHVLPQKVRVHQLGVDAMYHPRSQAQDRAILKKYAVEPQSYLLYAGALDFRKNLDTLLKAYALLRQMLKGAPRLILIGKSDPSHPALYPDLQSVVRQFGLQDNVMFLGEVPDVDLPVLYRHATLFVFPSLYEGFGLPPLEAMASGVPVVCSAAASLPEVVGDAGLLVNARDPQVFADAMLKVFTHPELAADLRQRGLTRARQFTWEKTADQWVQAVMTVSKYRQEAHGQS